LPALSRRPHPRHPRCAVHVHFVVVQAREALRHPWLREYPPPKRVEDMPPCPFVAYGPGEVPPGVGVARAGAGAGAGAGGPLRWVAGWWSVCGSPPRARLCRSPCGCFLAIRPSLHGVAVSPYPRPLPCTPSTPCSPLWVRSTGLGRRPFLDCSRPGTIHSWAVASGEACARGSLMGVRRRTKEQQGSDGGWRGGGGLHELSCESQPHHVCRQDLIVVTAQGHYPLPRLGQATSPNNHRWLWWGACDLGGEKRRENESMGAGRMEWGALGVTWEAGGAPDSPPHAPFHTRPPWPPDGTYCAQRQARRLEPSPWPAPVVTPTWSHTNSR
jgi:hypothetical protein